MYPNQFDYHRAASVAEAVELLSSLPDAKLVAGGHSLIPAMKLRAAQPAALVDIGRIPGLSDIAADGDSLVIGALATHAAVADSAAVRGGCPLLHETGPPPSETSRCETGGRSGAVWPTPIREPTIPPRCWRSAPRSRPWGRAANGRSPLPTSSWIS